MPTGYTSEIYDGNLSLRDYILNCARGMGFLILMRDEHADAEIPKKYEPEDYHLRRIDEAKKRREELDAMSPQQVQDAATQDYQERHKSYLKSRQRNDVLDANYRTMLTKTVTWDDPELLSGLKDLMLEQLKYAREFDVYDYDSDSAFFKPPKQKSPEEWLAEQYKAVNRDIEYNSREWDEEVARTVERNVYLDALWASLPDE